MPETTILPLTPERWPDFERLFGARGACGGCWCMYWRLTRRQFDEQKGDLNRRHMQAIVEAGETPGLLAYLDARPPGSNRWLVLHCATPGLPHLERSRILKAETASPSGRWSASSSPGLPPPGADRSTAASRR
jgi:hypothetical protein